MTGPSWQVAGQYYENCSCDFVCPCITGALAAMPTKGWCTVAMAFQIDRGTYGKLALDGLGFIVLLHTPEEMGKGNWSVGVIVDERASAQQKEAVTAIASGAAGGPMSALSPLVGKFLGVDSAPIRFERAGAKWSVTAGGLVGIAAEGAMGLDPSATEPMHMENTGHPAASRYALAHASKSHVHALGLSWDDSSGKQHGQYAPFSWRSA